MPQALAAGKRNLKEFFLVGHLLGAQDLGPLYFVFRIFNDQFFHILLLFLDEFGQGFFQVYAGHTGTAATATSGTEKA